ncbi:MAG: hypothetical protein G3H99_01290 [Ferrovum sp.]|nr:hypothetical protein [Ferrovum sp.]NDU86559.1 hypothetical protein [Ferrovum sp.]
MNRMKWAMMAIGLTLVSVAAVAGDITILSPKAGETLAAGDHVVSYNVHPSPNGNHLHVYVDQQDEPIISHAMTHCPCEVALPKLAPGQHSISIKEATASHGLTGVESKVSFTVK